MTENKVGLWKEEKITYQDIDNLIEERMKTKGPLDKETFYRGMGNAILERIREYNSNIVSYKRKENQIDLETNVIFIKTIYKDIRDVEYPREDYKIPLHNSKGVKHLYYLLLLLTEMQLLSTNKQINFVYVEDKKELIKYENSFSKDVRKNIDIIIDKIDSGDNYLEELYRNIMELSAEVMGRDFIEEIGNSLNRLKYLSKADNEDFEIHVTFYYNSVSELFNLDREEFVNFFDSKDKFENSVMTFKH